MRGKRPPQIVQLVKKLFATKDPMRLLGSYLARVGHNLAYAALLLYHSYKKPDTPGWAKRIVIGSFAYLIAPLDSLPDLTPFIGLTDDLGVLMFGLVSIAGHVNEDVRKAARTEMTRLFGITDYSVLSKVDEKI